MRHICEKCDKEIDSIGPYAACTRKLANRPQAWCGLILMFIAFAAAPAVIKWSLWKMGVPE
ncbi:MAG: hypothetical protein K8R36_17080 [Planctomycetales bacterium]|nr:hypothetical protein [Planctomycetales bacterium]